DDTNKQRLGNVMAHLVESLRVCSIMLQPFLTETPEKIFTQIGVSDKGLQSWDSIHNHGSIKAGTKVQKGVPIFPRLDMEEETEKIKNMMTSTIKEQEKPQGKPEITYDDFMKLDLRVAEVIKAEKMKNADKLLQLKVDLGDHKRQIISGIAAYYTPSDLVGKKVICVTNLKPVKLRGEMSEGMILSGESPDGTLSLAQTDQSLPNGSVVK